MKAKPIFVLVSLLVLASMLLAACASATPAATEAPTEAAATEAPTEAATTPASNPDVIIIGTTDKIASLDPADAYATHDWEVIKNISDGLVTWTPGTTELVADLATDLGTVSEDGLTYTFTLKDGIKTVMAPMSPPPLTAQLNRLLTIGPSCRTMLPILAVPYIKSIPLLMTRIVFVLTTRSLTSAAFLHCTVRLCRPRPLQQTPAICSDRPCYGTRWVHSQFNADEQLVLEPKPIHGPLSAKVKRLSRFYSDANTLALQFRVVSGYRLAYVQHRSDTRA